MGKRRHQEGIGQPPENRSKTIRESCRDPRSRESRFPKRVVCPDSLELPTVGYQRTWKDNQPERTRGPKAQRNGRKHRFLAPVRLVDNLLRAKQPRSTHTHQGNQAEEYPVERGQQVSDFEWFLFWKPNLESQS